MNWKGEHRFFIVEMFIKYESVPATQRAFRVHFNLSRLGRFCYRLQRQSIEQKSTGHIRPQNSGKCGNA